MGAKEKVPIPDTTKETVVGPLGDKSKESPASCPGSTTKGAPANTAVATPMEVGESKGPGPVATEHLARTLDSLKNLYAEVTNCGITCRSH